MLSLSSVQLSNVASVGKICEIYVKVLTTLEGAQQSSSRRVRLSICPEQKFVFVFLTTVFLLA